MSYQERMSELVRQRERLLVRCDAERAEIAALASQWETPLKLADRAIAGINYLREHPVLLGVIVALAAIVHRRGWWGWVQRGIVLWRGYRAFRRSGIRRSA